MLHKARYYFEVISLPIFILLTLGLAINGIRDIFSNNAHTHNISLDTLFTYETLAGVLLVFLFTWIWHLPALKKWVPCSHEHCHDEQTAAHIIATLALCAHFFPEAEIRHALLTSGNKNPTDILVLLGFASHFVVDIVVAIFISSFWEKPWQFWLSLVSIGAVWIYSASLSASHYGDFLNNGWVLLLSSFLLAMFIHKPHKPVVDCHDCGHD